MMETRRPVLPKGRCLKLVRNRWSVKKESEG